MRAKVTRRALFMSMLSLLLCVSMLVGTTFAWFTDSVNSGANKIVAGNLKVDLLMAGSDGTYTSIAGKDTAIFGSGNALVAQDNAAATLWEPGKTQIVYLGVANKGSLDLKYNIVLNVIDGGLIGALEYAVVDGAKFGELDAYTNWASLKANAQTGDIAAGTTVAAPNGAIKAGDDAVDYFALAVHMKEEAGNEYQGKDITIDVAVLATQLASEADSFDNQYDKDAVYQEEIPTPDQLQAKYEFVYYSTFNDAIEAVNDGVAVDSSVNKEDATAGVYMDENNVLHVVLLKDTTEMYLWPAADMVINLGGHTFTSKDNMAMYCPSGNIRIDGRLPGSAMQVTTSDGVPAQGIMVDAACNLTIDGGTYTCIATNQTSAVVMARGTVTAQNATFIGKSTTGRMDGFSTYPGSTTNIVNCDILAAGQNAKPNGVYVSNDCSVTITDSDIKGYANYNHNGNSYTASSLGIYQSANSMLELNNCHVEGTLAGIQTYGALHINGGVYEGYGHGGFYFAGRSTTSYIRNATIRESAMPEGYTNNNGTNHVGFYIGTGSGNTIYMDNCTIESFGDAVVLRGSSADSLYISNSRIEEGRRIRIDSAVQKLFIGTGCNFTADNTSLPAAVTQTEETYIQK